MTGLQTTVFEESIVQQPLLEYGKFAQDDIVTEEISKQRSTSATATDKTTPGSQIQESEESYPYQAISHYPKSSEHNHFAPQYSDSSRMTHSSQKLQGNLVSSTMTNEGGGNTQLSSTLLPPPPMPPLLPPALAAVASGSGTPCSGIMPPFIHFQTSPATAYYLHPQAPSTPPLSVSSSGPTAYPPHNSQLLTSEQPTATQYHEYQGHIPSPAISSTNTDTACNNAAAMYQLVTPSNEGPPSQVHTSHSVVPPIFPSMFPLPPHSTNTDQSYASNDLITSAVTTHDTNQSFSLDNHHNGFALHHHLPTMSLENGTSSSRQDAMETVFYTEGGIAYPFYTNDIRTAPTNINMDNKGKCILVGEGNRSQKETKGKPAVFKTNANTPSSIAMTNETRSTNKTRKNGIEGGIPSDGYTSSISQASTRFSSKGHSTSSSLNHTANSKSSKGGNSLQQQQTSTSAASYQKQHLPKQKQQKSQSLDRSSDSDFTSTTTSPSKKDTSSSSSPMTTCDLCKLTFPSQSVLDNHLKGSRHARRIKSQQAFRQLQDNGTTFRRQNIIHEDGTMDDDGLHFGEIGCEVCEVSVNSSHQLQAHLAGK